jgi:class 3 adenylate cyclase/tetratricopeptide (TPR) repeat protein
MTCRSCGVENPAGAKFCVECGAPQSTACPGCGAPVMAGQKFCAECGHRLPEAAPARAPAGVSGQAHAAVARPAETERRLVTVLFADLVGFTTISEGRDAEAVRDLLGRYFDVSREIVRRYGGTIEKFIGDAVMAVWGTPVAHEDDAERAVRAGLDLVEAVGHLGMELRVQDLRARVGVLTGEAAVNLAAVDQGMVAGDLVNTASRLQSAAQPGMVLVGESTMQAASGAVAFEPAGEHVLKGKAAPVAAWQAIRVVAQVKGRGRADVLEPPFVGRETEFRLLRELFHATGRERRARLVSLTGQAGIGKSRLAWEFSKYTDGLAETILWHEGRTPSYGEGVAFWALGEMVRKRAGLAESDDESATRRGVAAMLEEYVPDAAERAFIEPAVLSLLGVGAVPAGGRDHLFAAWRALFERVAEKGTVALVFEDLHWADDGLLDFIEHLLEWSRNHPIYVVTLARPELLDRRPTWGAGQRNATALPLGPLAEAEIRTMLTSLVPGLPEPAIRTILERADGIPLYAVETIRTLVADGRLVAGPDGRYMPAGELGTLDVPDSLRGLIAARLDALPPADRSLVADGAVLGKTFTPEALAAVSGEPKETLEPRLRELDRLELLELNTDPRSPERGQYGFVQSLIREVAYGTLSRRDRRQKHLAAARFFESLGEGELAGALATHYMAAWQAMPEGDEGAAIAAQAGVSLRAAADRALALGSPAQALAHLDHACELPGIAPADRAAILERAGEAARIAGRYDVALARYSQAVELRRDLGDQDALAGAIAGAGDALARVGQPEAALEMLNRGLADVPDADGPGLVALLGKLAFAYRRNYRQSDALAATERMLELAERLRLHRAVLEGIMGKAAIYSATGRLIEGEALVDGGRRMAEAFGLTREAIALLGQQISISGDEDPRHAVGLAREIADAARRLGDMQVLVNGVLNGLDAAVHTGDWTWAREEADRVLAMDLATPDRIQLSANARVFDQLRGRPDPRFESSLAELLDAAAGLGGLDTFLLDFDFWPAWMTGDFDRAMEIQVRIAAGDDLNAPIGYDRAIRAAAWKGDARRARELYDTLVALGRRGGMLDIARLGAEANVTAAEGARDLAERLYREAVARFDSLGCDFDVAQCALDAAVILGPHDPFGREMTEVARPILERLEAAPYLERLDALVPVGGAEPAEERVS